MRARAGAWEALLEPVGCSGIDVVRRECADPGLVVVRAIGDAWWRSVILPLDWWADRRMRRIHGGLGGVKYLLHIGANVEHIILNRLLELVV